MRDFKTEPHVVINDDRTITVPKELRKIAVQFDHNIETVIFDCPRYWDGHDLSELKIYINYIRVDAYRDRDVAENIKVDDADNNLIHFEWTLTRNVTLMKGKIRFLICAVETDSDGKELRHWNSELNEEMHVSEGLEVGDFIHDLHADIITDLLTRMDKILVANSPILDKTLTERGLAADAKATGDRLDALMRYKTNYEEFVREVTDIKQKAEVIKSRVDALSSLPGGSTAGDAELNDAKIDIYGNTHPNIGEAIRYQVSDLLNMHKDQATRLDCEYTEVDSKSGDELSFDRVAENMLFASEAECDVWTCNGNYFPTIKNHIATVGSFAEIDILEEEFTATTLAGKTYQNVKTKPIFLKAGTYVFHREYEIVSGKTAPYEVNSIGFCYITLCTKEGENVSVNVHSIQGIDSHKKITFDEDVYILMNIYTNMNANLDYDLTIRFYNFSITKDEYSEYIPYQGENVRSGGEGILKSFNGIRVYSDKDITVSYIKPVGMSYEDLLGLVKNKIVEPSNVVVCWGDSLTNGTGSSTLKPAGLTLDVSYPGVLGRLISDGKTVLNGGVGGEPSWMVAARQGGEDITVEPLTIPANTVPVRVHLKGQEQDHFYDNSIGKWTYLEDNLSFNIGVNETALVNPCFIAGIEGTLSRTLIASGAADPETGETVQTNKYAYYFTRAEAGEELTTIVPKRLVTYGYSALRDAINVIWVGQNDAPLHDGKYITQGIDRNRVQCMIDILSHNKYIVMDLPSGTDESRSNDVQAFNQQFGSHYLNIRKYIAKYGVTIANSLGANLSISASDQELIDKGQIPNCLRIDSVHGNYWYYQIVARAVYEKGLDLGYWK